MFDSMNDSPDPGKQIIWSTRDFIEAHKAVKVSGMFNFEGCRIPIPTKINYEFMETALGNNLNDKEYRILDLLKYGMPIDCGLGFGVQKPQKNHSSAINFKEAINDYISKNVQCQAMLGPFTVPPH